MPIKMQTGESCCVEAASEDRNVTVNIPSDANTALALEMDDVVVITIKGRVKGIHATKGEDVWGTPGDIRIEVDSIDVDGRNAFAELAEN